MDDCFLNLIYIMKKNILLLSFLCNFSLLLSAQTNVEKGLQSINRSSAEATINFLASDELQGREAGFHGSRVTSEYIVSLLQWMGVSPLADCYFQPFDAYRKERQKKGRLEVHPDSIAKLKQEVHQKLSMRNVLGMIPGKNTKEYVIVGAHFDHLGIDPALDGDQIYNGADDNASGVSAVLQIARAFLASGQQPERNVIFAFWDGEEKGLLGSKYFVQTCPFLSQIKGYLNFDMIGRNNKPQQPKQVVYFYTAVHPVFGDWLKEDIRKYAEGLEQTKIVSVYRNVPVQLAKENKKFQLSKIDKKARSREYMGCITWLEDAGVISVCYCLQYPELPLKGNYDDSKFKIYYPDTGLLIASLDEEAQEDLRANKNLGVYKGALYENFVAEAFVKQGLGLYYYKKENATLEEDFFVRTKDELVPVEVKANRNRSKSLRQLISGDSYGDIHWGIKLADSNVGIEDGIYTFPYFCTFLLKRYLRGK